MADDPMKRTNELLEKLVRLLCPHMEGCTVSTKFLPPDEWGVEAKVEVHRCKVCTKVMREVG